MSDQKQNSDNSQGDSAEHNIAKGDNVRASWRVSLDDLTANLSHNTEEAAQLFIWCFLWCIDDTHTIRMEEFAKRVGADATTISRICQGRYFKPGEEGAASKERQPISDKLLSAMEQFKEMEQERSLAKRTVFIMTPTAKRIFTACDLARESQSPVFLVGPSHIGKTWALKSYTEENNHGHTIYVRLQAASGLGGMVKVIAKALGISDKANTADLIERIKRALKPNMLLVLDEVHELIYTYRKESFFACLEVLREFYDHAGCGMVLCGTQLLFKRVSDNRGELEQLLRRGVHKVILPTSPTKGDVAAIAESLGLEMPSKSDTVQVRHGGQNFTDSPYKMLKQLGEEEGLKAITERLRYGSKLAGKAKVKLSWEHVVRAHLIIKGNATNASDWE